MERDSTLGAFDLNALKAEVQGRPVPRHVAIIMDGNGRWAEEQGQPRLAGHREGSTSVREVTRAARRIGVRWLTLYAFSAQNWSRPIDEVEGLMDLLAEYLVGERAEIMENGIRLSAIGELSRLPPRVRDSLFELIAASADNKGMTLTLALSYGGREELVNAARTLASAAAAGTLSPDDIDEDAFRARLWTAGMPDPEMVIRTSGELRLSNFLLFQLAYAEIVATDTPWPVFRERQFLLALREFQRRERRFGLTSAQVRATGTAAAAVAPLP